MSQINPALHFQTAFSAWEKKSQTFLLGRGIQVVHGLSTPSNSMLHFVSNVVHLDFADQMKNRASPMDVIVIGKPQRMRIKGLSRHEKSNRRQTANKDISTMVNNRQLKRNRYYVVHFLAANEHPLRGTDDKAPLALDAMESESENSDGGQHSSGLFLKLFAFTMCKDQALGDAFKTIPSYLSRQST
jgi:hypothetical protein